MSNKISFHQAGLVIWKKAVAGRKELPRGFRSEMIEKISKLLKCTKSTASTYVQHYAQRGAAKWDYQAELDGTKKARKPRAAKGKAAKPAVKAKAAAKKAAPKARKAAAPKAAPAPVRAAA